MWIPGITRATVNISTVRGDYPDIAIPVSVQDDVAGLIVSKNALALDEGDSSAFAVRLRLRPTGDGFGVAIDSLNAAVASTSLNSLTFNRSNWQKPQAVVVHRGPGCRRAG